MWYGFVSNFVCFQQCKNFENRLRFDKLTESLKVGTFETQCRCGEAGDSDDDTVDIVQIEVMCICV